MVQTMSKQLGEYLQEQQEPFTLDQYLLERGSLRSSNFSSSTRDFRCCSVNSTKFLKRSSSCGEKKRKKVILGCSKIVRAVVNKLVITISSHNHKIKNGASDDHNKTNKAQDNVVVDTNDDDKFSSASSTTVFNSCSDTDNAEDKKVSADRKMKLEFLEDSKQLSPVSVLEETESSDDVSPDHNYQENLKVKKPEEFTRPSVSKNKPEKASDHSQYIKNKKAIQQTKQLLFDCVKEVMEKQKRKKRETEKIQRIMGAEQLWELLRENIWLWSQDSIDETNINHLIHLDLLDSYEQSNGFELHIRETGKEIGDAILEDTIYEIAVYMYNCSASK